MQKYISCTEEMLRRFSQENGAGSKIKPFEFFKRPYFDRSKFIVQWQTSEPVGQSPALIQRPGER